MWYSSDSKVPLQPPGYTVMALGNIAATRGCCSGTRVSVPEYTVVTLGYQWSTRGYCSGTRLPLQPPGDTVATIVKQWSYQEILQWQ